MGPSCWLRSRTLRRRGVAYDQVAELKLAKVTYKASGQPDATAAKRVVAGLGIGRHIVVKTTEGKEYHGNIRAIDLESFAVQPDHQAAAVQIAYSEVIQLGPNLSKTAWILIGVGVGVVVTLIIIGAVIASND